ncbi:uncharacterized protein ACBT57_025441 isoform 4-T7 [Dama dama]
MWRRVLREQTSASLPSALYYERWQEWTRHSRVPSGAMEADRTTPKWGNKDPDFLSEDPLPSPGADGRSRHSPGPRLPTEPECISREVSPEELL